MPLLKDCIQIHAKRRFVLEENRSRVNFDNPSTHKIKQVTVDGCAITSGPRCDYLINVDTLDKSVFVELKGADVERAVVQLTASHQQLFENVNSEVVWIVSSTRCPLASTEVQNLALKIRRQVKATLLVRNTPVNFKL